MKITFLGTGAADWKMESHRELAGFRRNASALIDSCLLIDPNATVPDALETFQIDSSEIRYMINTHQHADHYSEATIQALHHADFYPMSAGDVLQLGNYTVKALHANHATCEKTVHFLITDGKSTVFYGLDGAWLTYDEVQEIKRNKVDLAVLDATVGNINGDYRIFEHNNLAMVLQLKESLQPYVDQFCISHMARTLHGTHEELAEQMKAHRILVAFDGLEITLP